MLGLLVCILLLAGFTQTQFFRDRLRAAAISRLDSLLIAEVQLGDLQGNLVGGFSLNYVSIKVQDDFLLSAERLDLKYDLFEIPSRIIAVDNITLVRPSITLVRGRDGIWNFKRMIRPKHADTTASNPFDWAIVINKLELQNGTVSLVDSFSLADEDHEEQDPRFVEYHNFALKDVNLVTSAGISARTKNATISALSFISGNPAFRLERLTGEFDVTPTSASVKNLAIKTGRSFLQIDAEMKDFNLLGGIELADLQNSPVTLSLKAHDIDLNELKEFIPQIHFLNGPVTLDLETFGEFGELNLKRLNVMAGQTAFHFSGAVFNLHKPRNLLLNVKCTESTLYSPDALVLLPAFHLPDYKSLGVTTLNFELYGKPLDFHTKLYLETIAGNVHADMTLKIGGPKTLAYKGELTLQNVDLARAVSNEKLASRLNGLVEISGEGTSIENLTATVKARIDSSEFRGQMVGPSRLTLEAKDRILSSTMAIALGSMRSEVQAVLNEQKKDAPSFAVEGKVSSLNLENLLHDKSLNSDLTLSISAEGTGLSWDRLGGDFILDFSPSRYGEYMISSGNVHLSLDQKDHAHKQLKVESNIADFTLSGAYDVQYLGRLISFEFQSLQRATAEKFASLDSSLRSSVDADAFARTSKSLATATETLDASFSLRLKDLEPISVVTGNRTFNGVGILTGSIKGNHENLEAHADLSLSDFFYGNVESGVLINGGSAVLDLSDLKPANPLKSADIRCVVRADKMHVNTTEFGELQATLEYGDESLNFAARTTLDRETHLNVQGRAKVSDDEVVFSLNNLDVAYRDFAWKADDGAVIGFKSHSARVQDLVMRRDSQSVTLSGDVTSDGILVAALTGSKINLNGLKYLLDEEEMSQDRRTFAGQADFSLKASGTLEHPDLHSTVKVGGVSYRTVPFGEITGDFSYKEEILSSLVEIRNSTSERGGPPALTISGVVPINLAWSKVDERLSGTGLNLSIKSSGVQMSILDPLLPTFDQLAGVLRCDMKLVGSAKKPTYQGTLSVDSCRFLFVPNNIFYTFEGVFHPEGERITVVEATVRNISSDKRLGREGAVKINGDFTFRDLKPSDFNLTAKGKLLVVKETTRKSSLSVYGNLFIELGSTGLHYTGNIDNSLLKGYVLISNSSLIFPPTQSSTTQRADLFIPTIVVDDTTKVAPEPDRSLSARYFAPVRDYFVKQPLNSKNGLPSKSFLEGVHYDLDVESAGGNTEIRMIFFTATGEELVANISGRVSITEDGKRWVGDMTVDRAYYYFYKRFEADGSIRYTGDYLNPELDIKAQYQGTRAVQDSISDRTEKIIVNLKITGTRQAPKLDISMTIDDVDYYSYSGPKSSDVNSDALQYLIAGNFPLTQSQKNDVASSIGSAVGSSLVSGATSLLTSNLSDFLRRETGFINSIEFSYGAQGTFGESADIRVSGVAAGGLWRYGGKILNDPFSNANVSILYSFGKIFDRPALRNFMFELERRVETSSIGQIGDRKEINSARLFYRFSF